MESRAQTDPAPIFYIGGTGRSGTNFLKDIMGKAPEVYALPFEHRILIDPEGLVDFYHSYASSWSPYMADYKIKRLRRFLLRMGHEPFVHRLFGDVIDFIQPRNLIMGPRYHGWKLAQTIPGYFYEVEKLINEMTSFNYAGKWPGSESYSLNPNILHNGPMSKSELALLIGEFIKRLVAKCLEVQGKSVFVEDNTWNILFAEELLAFNPQSKIIHIYRHPRDVIASLIRQQWAPTDALKAINWYKDIVGRWLEVRKQIPPERVFELCFEELIIEPHKSLGELSAFTSLELSSLADTIDESKAHIGRWKTDLTKNQISLIASELAPLEQEFGYSKD
jgi:hypothetical protein